MIAIKKALKIGGVLVILAIILLVYFVIKVKLEEKQNLANIYRNAGKPIPTIAAPKSEDTYTNTVFNFSFTFGNLGEFQKYDDYKITLPDGHNDLDLDPIVTFKHIIPEQYCSLKGDCIPYTEDMTFGVAIYDANIDQYAHANPQLVRSPITEKRYSYSYSEGAEGEGIKYYLIALSPARIAVIFHKYIDESVVTKYKNSKDFIPFADQQKRMDSMITSFNWK